jgi:hypothetical protein
MPKSPIAKPTKDRPIVLALTFTEYGIIDACLHAVSQAFKTKSEIQRRRLRNDEQSISNIVNTVMRLISKEAEVSTGNLSPERLASELKTLATLNDFFVGTYVRVLQEIIPQRPSENGPGVD